MGPIDKGTREAISGRAQEMDRWGDGINRRALAREFGVSPQTVARVLDGPNARRGDGPVRGELGDGRWAVAGLVGALALGALIWRFSMGPPPIRRGPIRLGFQQPPGNRID